MPFWYCAIWVAVGVILTIGEYSKPINEEPTIVSFVGPAMVLGALAAYFF